MELRWIKNTGLLGYRTSGRPGLLKTFKRPCFSVCYIDFIIAELRTIEKTFIRHNKSVDRSGNNRSQTNRHFTLLFQDTKTLFDNLSLLAHLVRYKGYSWCGGRLRLYVNSRRKDMSPSLDLYDEGNGNLLLVPT